MYDQQWLRQGVKVTTTQARIIDCLSGPAGMTDQGLAEALKLRFETLSGDLRHLIVQALIEPLAMTGMSSLRIGRDIR